ncbi:MAG TPA: hypothetical protein VFE72_03025 [Lysobacter sp.]|nr:hypothetical protein [Lysobacter sp.]
MTDRLRESAERVTRKMRELLNIANTMGASGVANDAVAEWLNDLDAAMRPLPPCTCTFTKTCAVCAPKIPECTHPACDCMATLKKCPRKVALMQRDRDRDRSPPTFAPLGPPKIG